jgi:hypothetical protein
MAINAPLQPVTPVRAGSWTIIWHAATGSPGALDYGVLGVLRPIASPRRLNRGRALNQALAPQPYTQVGAPAWHVLLGGQPRRRGRVRQALALPPEAYTQVNSPAWHIVLNARRGRAGHVSVGSLLAPSIQASASSYPGGLSALNPYSRRLTGANLVRMYG